jgi:putative endonuclease
MYHVYVLRSLKDGRLYTGVTENLERRLREHSAGKTRSLRYRRPLVLVFSESFATKAEAVARERFFKTPEGGAVKQALVAKALNEQLR